MPIWCSLMVAWNGRTDMRLAPLVLWGVSLVVQADTLIMSAPGNVQMTMRDEAGATRSCSISRVDIIGAFNSIRAAVVTSMTVQGVGCVIPVITPPVAANAAWSATAYTAKGSSTWLTINRMGSAAGSLNVQWSASGGATPASGTLIWTVGETGQKFIKLTLPPAPATVRLTLPASTAILTVVI